MGTFEKRLEGTYDAATGGALARVGIQVIEQYQVKENVLQTGTTRTITSGVQKPNRPCVHIYRLVQLIDRNRLAGSLGLVDVSGVKYKRVHVPLIALRYRALRRGDCAFGAGRALG
ncbi:MAG: hypothetical protein OXJ55_09895 [Caldilineaceae bacterium]|nr:hypothetical protein [Caldilineaceae bacterium]